MEKYTVRPVEKYEIHILQKVAIDTFTAAFVKFNTKENLALYLENAFSLSRLNKTFAHPHSYFYFIENMDAVKGYLKLNIENAQTESFFPKGMELERIYVLPESYGKGVGQLLLDHAFAFAKNHNCETIWLGVWEHNLRAIRFYEKNRFKIFDRHPFMMGKDEQMDYLMRFDF